MTQYSLDGSVQYTLLAVVLAVVAYIRNIPYKELKESVAKSHQPWKCCWIKFQLIVLDLMQIILAAVGALLVGRSSWATGMTHTSCARLDACADLAAHAHFGERPQHFKTLFN